MELLCAAASHNLCSNGVHTGDSGLVGGQSGQSEQLSLAAVPLVTICSTASYAGQRVSTKKSRGLWRCGGGVVVAWWWCGGGAVVVAVELL